MQSLYRPILKQALRISWRNKYLWFFGLFAALLGNGGAYNLGINNFDKVQSQGIFLQNLKVFFSNLAWQKIDFGNALASLDFWGVIFFMVLIGIGAFIFWLAIVSQGALVKGVSDSLWDTKNEGSRFNSAFRKGIHKFWSVFLLQILLSVVLMVFLILVSLPFFIFFMMTEVSLVWLSILIFLSFIILVPIGIVLSFIVKYALIYIVNENKYIGDALVLAWRLFKKNWIVSLEMGLLLFLINILAGVALLILIVFLALPFVLLAMLAGYAIGQGLMWFVVLLGLITFILVLFLFGAALQVFQMSAWVILFNRLKDGGVYSRIVRWAVGLTNREKVGLGEKRVN